VIRRVLLAHAEAGAKVARSDADRHARRVRELIAQQQKLLGLYHEDGVSKEVLQAEQQRIKAQQATAERLATAANHEVAEVDQVLSDALTLIDARRVPYLTGSATERRLINLAIYLMLLVSDPDTITAAPTPIPPACAPGPQTSPRSRPRPPGTAPVGQKPRNQPRKKPQPHFSGPRFEIRANGGEGGTMFELFPGLATHQRTARPALWLRRM
jgi:hypothetical protein